MSSCASCKERVNRTTEDSIQCTTDCKKLYHTKCVGLTAAEFQNKATLKNWTCKQCSTPSLKEIFSLLKEVQETLKSNQVETNRRFDNIESIQNETNKRLDELEKSQQFISDEYEEMKNQFSSVPQQIQKLEEALEGKSLVIKNLTSRMLAMEQYSRKSSIELRNVHHRENENAEEIVMKIASKLEIPLEKSCIDAAHRLPKWNEQSTPSIIVKFISRKTKEQFMEKRKTVILNSAIIGADTNGKILIGESLAPYYKDLLWKAKLRANDAGYQYVWWSDGSVLARKEPKSRIIKIRTYEDIEKIHNNYPPAVQRVPTVTCNQPMAPGARYQSSSSHSSLQTTSQAPAPALTNSHPNPTTLVSSVPAPPETRVEIAE